MFFSNRHDLASKKAKLVNENSMQKMDLSRFSIYVKKSVFYTLVKINLQNTTLIHFSYKFNIIYQTYKYLNINA